jgi:aminomethyltransferase
MSPLRTPLFDWHVAHQGRMVEFGGWEMPVQYIGIVAEHHAVRRDVGLFDISHMGRFLFQGTGARSYVDGLVTCRVDNLRPGQIRYGLMCRDDGGILDDVLVYAHDSVSGVPVHDPDSDPAPEDLIGMVVNAGNREKLLAWLRQQPTHGDVAFRDRTLNTAMFALQGPRAIYLLQPLVDVDLRGMKSYTGRSAVIAGIRGYVSRTGYTGEDGFEVIVASDFVLVWERLVSAGAMPCGLGARDMLRLEAAMPLYGHELSETIDPFTAGLDFAVKLDKAAFVGQTALRRIAARTDRQVRIGLELEGRRIAREGAVILRDGEPVGVVTSGTFSPTLERPIAMAYVDQAAAAMGPSLSVDIRGTAVPATVTALPFYRRASR